MALVVIDPTTYTYNKHHWSLSKKKTIALVVIDPTYIPLMVVIEKENNRIRDQNKHHHMHPKIVDKTPKIPNIEKDRYPPMVTKYDVEMTY
jgi:hypothetical protein